MNGSVNWFTTVTTKLTVSGISTFGQTSAIAGVAFHLMKLILPITSKAQFGTGKDLEIYHSGSNSFIADGGGSLQLDATPDIRFLNNNTGIGTIGAGGLDIAGGITLGATGIATLSQVKIGAGAYGVDIAGGTHIGATRISTFNQVIFGRCCGNFISSSIIMLLEVITATTSPKVGTAVTVTSGVSCFWYSSVYWYCNGSTDNCWCCSNNQRWWI